MNKIAAIKLVANVIVGAGTTSISTAIIRNNVSPTTLIEKISVGAAAIMIGSMAAEATKAHTGAQIDAIATIFSDFKSDTASTED